MILQWAETQIDSAHEPEHMPGALHGHTWFIRVARRVEDAIPCALVWRTYVEELTRTYDHRQLKPGESLAEHLAAQIGALSGAAEVEVWRYVRGGKIGATWRA